MKKNILEQFAEGEKIEATERGMKGSWLKGKRIQTGSETKAGGGKGLLRSQGQAQMGGNYSEGGAGNHGNKRTSYPRGEDGAGLKGVMSED